MKTTKNKSRAMIIALLSLIIPLEAQAQDKVEAWGSVRFTGWL